MTQTAWLNQLEQISFWLRTITPVIHICGVVCAAHAVMHVRSSRGAIAWSISLLTFPWLTLPLYLVFGRRHFEGYREVLRAAYLRERRTVHQVYQQLQSYQTSLPPALEQFQQVLDRFLPITFLRSNHIQLLINAEQAYQEMLQAIQQAQSYILLQVYIVHDDVIGNRLRRILLEKAKQGVQVFLLYDGIGSQQLSWRYRRSLRQGGVHIAVFRSSRWLRNPFQLNFRNHRKILIVDGQVGFTGGLNIGDEYLGKHPPLSPWRDTAVMLRGPIVQPLQTVFLNDWFWTSGYLPKVNWELPVAETVEGAIACVFPTGAADPFPICELAFVNAINQAQHRLWIASPYFVPDDAVITALQLAACRGVDVRILLPKRPDHWLVYLCAFSYYTEMLDAGVQIYRYIPGFMHQKVILVDDQIAGVGTVNLDNRSFVLNFEVTVWVYNPPFIQQITTMFEQDFSLSRLASKGDYSERSCFFRLAARIARLFATIL